MTIYLYVKQCSHCGLKYFGKTTNRNPYYVGSGKYWTNHINAHKSKVENVETFAFDSQDEATKFALSFSQIWNIVESPEWANLIVETAKGGGSPIGNKNGCGSRSDEFKRRRSLSQLGKSHKKHTTLHKGKSICTLIGVFISCTKAAEAYVCSRK